MRKKQLAAIFKLSICAAVLFCASPTVSLSSPPADAAHLDWQSEIPRVVYPDKAWVDLYETTWKIAADRVRKGPAGMVASPYLDENCYDDQIWIWDGCFMVMFARYAPKAFPGKETLLNYYVPIHDKVKTPLLIHLRDNPPLFAWVEHENYVLSGDRKQAQLVLNDKKYLQKHFDYFNNVPKGDVAPDVSPAYNPIYRGVVKNDKGQVVGFTWTGGASGMDNTPRGRDAGGYDKILWIDAISQQALSALYIARLHQKLGNQEDAKVWQTRYDAIKTLVNEKYWDERDGFYYDISVETGEPCRIKTPASFWAMLAEIPSKEQAARMVEILLNEKYFGKSYPWNTLSRDDKDYNATTGDYWRGGIWLPLAYMGTKALEKYGYYELADSLAKNIIQQQLNTYHSVTPHTIWECYSPSKDQPSTEHGRRARPDFCGWSALGPISLFIENVLGFREISALDETVRWSLKKENGTHGIRNLNFGNIRTDILYNSSTNTIEVTSNGPYTLIVNGTTYRITKGKQTHVN
jgi:hypothetical protein